MGTPTGTFRCLSLLSSSSSPSLFISKLSDKKTYAFHLHLARCGLASLAPITCRAAVVYGTGKPLQVGLICLLNFPWTTINLSKVEQVEVAPPGPGEVKYLDYCQKHENVSALFVGASSPCLSFDMPHRPLGVERRRPRHDGSFPHHSWSWRCPGLLSIELLGVGATEMCFFKKVYICRCRGSWVYWWRSERLKGDHFLIRGDSANAPEPFFRSSNTFSLAGEENYVFWYFFKKISGWGSCDTMWIASLWQVCSLPPS